MPTLLTAAMQPTLLDPGVVAHDPAFLTLDRRELGAGAWLDHAPEWVRGSDTLFASVLDAGSWAQHALRMYDDIVDQPRLSTSWTVGELPACLDAVRAIGAALSARYRVALTRVSANLYRDGSDSVAWHGDRVARDLPTSVIAVVSLGHRRPFRLRPRGGGASLGLDLGRGDLVVMGGTCQRTWQHAVPKVRAAGPRISLMFREAYGDAELQQAERNRLARRRDPRSA